MKAANRIRSTGRRKKEMNWKKGIVCLCTLHMYANANVNQCEILYIYSLKFVTVNWPCNPLGFGVKECVKEYVTGSLDFGRQHYSLFEKTQRDEYGPYKASNTGQSMCKTATRNQPRPSELRSLLVPLVLIMMSGRFEFLDISHCLFKVIVWSCWSWWVGGFEFLDISHCLFKVIVWS